MAKDQRPQGGHRGRRHAGQAGGGATPNGRETAEESEVRRAKELLEARFSDWYHVQGDIEPGGEIGREEEIAPRLGVSREAIREALRQLRDEGRVLQQDDIWLRRTGDARRSRSGGSGDPAPGQGAGAAGGRGHRGGWRPYGTDRGRHQASRRSRHSSGRAGRQHNEHEKGREEGMSDNDAGRTGSERTPDREQVDLLKLSIERMTTLTQVAPGVFLWSTEELARILGNPEPAALELALRELSDEGVIERQTTAPDQPAAEPGRQEDQPAAASQAAVYWFTAPSIPQVRERLVELGRSGNWRLGAPADIAARLHVGLAQVFRVLRELSAAGEVIALRGVYFAAPHSSDPVVIAVRIWLEYAFGQPMPRGSREQSEQAIGAVAEALIRATRDLPNLDPGSQSAGAQAGPDLPGAERGGEIRSWQDQLRSAYQACVRAGLGPDAVEALRELIDRVADLDAIRLRDSQLEPSEREEARIALELRRWRLTEISRILTEPMPGPLARLIERFRRRPRGGGDPARGDEPEGGAPSGAGPAGSGPRADDSGASASAPEEAGGAGDGRRRHREPRGRGRHSGGRGTPGGESASATTGEMSDQPDNEPPQAEVDRVKNLIEAWFIGLDVVPDLERIAQTADELAESMHEIPAVVAAALNELVREGKLAHEDDGYYRSDPPTDREVAGWLDDHLTFVPPDGDQRLMSPAEAAALLGGDEEQVRRAYDAAEQDGRIVRYLGGWFKAPSIPQFPHQLDSLDTWLSVALDKGSTRLRDAVLALAEAIHDVMEGLRSGGEAVEVRGEAADGEPGLREQARKTLMTAAKRAKRVGADLRKLCWAIGQQLEVEVIRRDRGQFDPRLQEARAPVLRAIRAILREVAGDEGGDGGARGRSAPQAPAGPGSGFGGSAGSGGARLRAQGSSSGGRHRRHEGPASGSSTSGKEGETSDVAVPVAGFVALPMPPAGPVSAPGSAGPSQAVTRGGAPAGGAPRSGGAPNPPAAARRPVTGAGAPAGGAPRSGGAPNPPAARPPVTGADSPAGGAPRAGGTPNPPAARPPVSGARTRAGGAPRSGGAPNPPAARPPVTGAGAPAPRASDAPVAPRLPGGQQLPLPGFRPVRAPRPASRPAPASNPTPADTPQVRVRDQGRDPGTPPRVRERGYGRGAEPGAPAAGPRGAATPATPQNTPQKPPWWERGDPDAYNKVVRALQPKEPEAKPAPASHPAPPSAGDDYDKVMRGLHLQKEPEAKTPETPPAPKAPARSEAPKPPATPPAPKAPARSEAPKPPATPPAPKAPGGSEAPKAPRPEAPKTPAKLDAPQAPATPPAPKPPATPHNPPPPRAPRGPRHP